MKTRPIVAGMLVILGMLTFTTVLAHAQTTSNGPYYATPSWDQQLPASTRFIVLLNWNSEAVLDRETGLVWEKAPGPFTNTFELADAFLCNDRNIGGRMGWRIPSVWELLTLVDPSQSNPFLPAGHPFTLGAGQPRFWTNTPVSVGFGSLTAWIVAFDLGSAATALPASSLRAWCVRGPGGRAPVNPASP
jgi:hypothetical protein